MSFFVETFCLNFSSLKASQNFVIMKFFYTRTLWMFSFAALYLSCANETVSPEYKRGYNEGVKIGQAEGYKRGLEKGRAQGAEAFLDKQVAHADLGIVDPVAWELVSKACLFLSIGYLLVVLVYFFPDLVSPENAYKWKEALAKATVVIASILLFLLFINTLNIYWFLGNHISKHGLITALLGCVIVFWAGILMHGILTFSKNQIRRRFYTESFMIVIVTIMISFFIYISVQYDLFFGESLRSGSALIIGAGFGFLSLIFRNIANRFFSDQDAQIIS